MEFRTGNGAPWLDLLQTLSGRFRGRADEALADVAALRTWLRLNGLEPLAAVTDDDLEFVRTARESLHSVTVALLRGRRPATADLRVLDDVLGRDEPLRLRRAGDALRLGRPAAVSQALARLVRDAVCDLTGPRLADLHLCGDDTCSGVFIDATGRRRWCSDQSCGNRVRVRAHRARASVVG